MSLLDAPRFSYRDATTAVACWRSVVFTVWGNQTLTLESAMNQVRACEAHGRAVGKGKLVEIVLLDPDVPMPEATVRDFLHASVERMGPYYSCVATLFQGQGFRAAMIRGVLTSLQLVSRTPFAQKVFSDQDACVAYAHPFAHRSDPRVANPAELLETLEEVRGHAMALGLFGA